MTFIADNSQAAKVARRLRDKDKIAVLFVCLGNICRSPAAEGVMRAITQAQGDESRWVIDSAGTGNYHIGDLPDKRMRVHAARRGYNLTHRCRQVDESDFDRFDLIIAMDNANLRDLRDLAPSPEAEAKLARMADWVTMATRHDHVPDPYYEGAEGFELVLDLLEDACRNLHDSLSPSH